LLCFSGSWNSLSLVSDCRQVYETLVRFIATGATCQYLSMHQQVGSGWSHYTANDFAALLLVHRCLTLS
jgi:hypothetical protein